MPKHIAPYSPGRAGPMTEAEVAVNGGSATHWRKTQETASRSSRTGASPEGWARGERTMDPIAAELAEAARARSARPRQRLTADMLAAILPAPRPFRDTAPISSRVDGPLAAGPIAHLALLGALREPHAVPFGFDPDSTSDRAALADNPITRAKLAWDERSSHLA